MIRRIAHMLYLIFWLKFPLEEYYKRDRDVIFIWPLALLNCAIYLSLLSISMLALVMPPILATCWTVERLCDWLKGITW
jgi:hypothetical protein